MDTLSLTELKSVKGGMVKDSSITGPEVKDDDQDEQ